ncbi:MAG: hypothetical protein QXU27_01785 [Candidatus Anstonellales archaeon]
MKKLRLGLCVACRHCEKIDIFQNIKCAVFSKTTPAIYCRYFLPITASTTEQSETKSIEEELKKEILKRLEKLTKQRDDQQKTSESQ